MEVNDGHGRAAGVIVTTGAARSGGRLVTFWRDNLKMKAHMYSGMITILLVSVLACAQNDVPPARNPATTSVVYKIGGSGAASVQKNIVYAKGDASLVFDAYTPKGLPRSSKLPAVIFISGASEAKDWKWFSDYGRLAAASGFIGINYNKRYPRGLAGLQSGFSDTLDLIQHLRDHATDLHIDKDRICIWAFSGGGRLMSAGMQKDQPYIRCLIAFYGVIDLTADADIEALPLQEKESALEKYSAVHCLQKLGTNLPPVLIARAGRDSEAINSGIGRFVSEAQKQNADLTFLNYPDGEHGFDGFNNTHSSRSIVRQAFSFITERTQK